MTWSRVLLVLLLAAGALYCKVPRVSKIVADTSISVEDGWIDYRDVRYQAEWGPEEARAGNARLFERAKYKSAPFFTHHTVLTTGEFSDSELVTIRHTGGGNFTWAAPRKPEGTLVVLHIVPLDEDVLDQLGTIDDGDLVELTGRVEIDGKVSGSDGSWLRLGHSNHKYFLVERATALAN